MNLYSPFHWFFGEYVFETEKSHFPRLATLLAEKKINVWKTVFIGETVHFSSSVFVFENVVDLAKEFGLRADVISKKGFPFLFARYRKRLGLIVGFFLGLFLMFYSQLFVWKITVEGNNELSYSEIEKALSECGIAVGSFIPDIDVRVGANRLLMDCDEISSAAISIKGTHLNISILEKTEKPEIIDRNGFYNVVATHDGIVLDVDPLDGAPQVKTGDAVYKGELLISCFIEGKNGSFHPTHARGDVYAAVNEEIVCEIPMERITKHYTGVTETKREFYILGKKLPSLSSVETSFEYFDAVSTERTIFLFGFIELPIKEFRVVYNEYIPETELITASLAELFAKEYLADYLDELDCEVLSCDSAIEFDQKNGLCLLKAEAVVKRNIAKEVPLELLSYKISEMFPNAFE